MLTSAQVTKGLRRPGRYLDQHGLYLVVQTADKRYWQYRYSIAGRERQMSFGPEGPITLEGARARHIKARALVIEGVDPLEERRKASAPTRTFESVALDYIAAHEPGWTNGVHRHQWRSTLAANVFPVIGSMPVAMVNTDAVLKVLEPIWHNKPTTASRLRGRIEHILDYARVKGWREGPNPALWRGNLAVVLASPAKLAPVQHYPALDWREAPELMARLMEQDGIGVRALQFAILTAARSGEVRGATWDEIDFQVALWTVPAARMKAGRLHRVPLSPSALAILEGAQCLRLSSLVFPGRDGRSEISNNTIASVLTRMGRRDLTVHGFRSTFRDWASDNGKPADAAEAALAHTPASKVVAAYARSDLLDQRRLLMREWGEFLTRPAVEVVTGELLWPGGPA
jgi:integrase